MTGRNPELREKKQQYLRYIKSGDVDGNVVQNRPPILDLIRAWFLEAAIDDLGFASAEPFEHMLDVYHDKLSKGHVCDLEIRNHVQDMVEPQRILDMAKSFIVIVESHSPYKLKDEPLKGYIATGCASIDYHLIIERKLKALQERLSTIGVSSEVICDKTPLSDRSIAVRAGLGIIRRNNMFYHPKFGSYIHIGALLMDYELPKYDAIAVKDPCGMCHRCTHHCPGQAINDDGTINSNTCVSYLTQKKDLSDEEMRKIGRHLYGCDVCQQICPANRGVRNKKPDLIIPYEYPLEELLDIDNKQFNTTFRQASAGWRGKRTMQRNALINLVNEGGSEANKIIEKMAGDDRSAIEAVFDYRKRQ